ncbi:hypothetical protein PF272_12880, partial [Gallibacterium sp. AGMB14963]|nr:hypothetical protein [Gallibacterium sp. AGMB14963]
MKKVFWNAKQEPITATYTKIFDDLRNEDMETGLLFEPCTLDDILDEADEIIQLDAIVSPYSKLELKMKQLNMALNRADSELKVVGMQISDPFMLRSTANVVALFELSDGQTISIYFHNPDVTPKKIAPQDEVISYKWLLNKKDVTIIVAPERGSDINVREVAMRMMKLAAKNSSAFARQNQKRAEKVQRIEETEKRIAEKEKILEDLEKQIDLLKATQSMAEADNAIDISDAKKGLNKYKAFFSTDQFNAIQDALKGEEAIGMASTLRTLFNRIEKMPKTYETDGQKENAIVYLHYFKNGNDWYITEKDMGGSGTRQAYGLTSLSIGDKPELGYISIDELTQNNAEIDLYWTPESLKSIQDAQQNTSPEPEQTAEPVQEQEPGQNAEPSQEQEPEQELGTEPNPEPEQTPDVVAEDNNTEVEQSISVQNIVMEVATPLLEQIGFKIEFGGNANPLGLPDTGSIFTFTAASENTRLSTFLVIEKTGDTFTTETYGYKADGERIGLVRTTDLPFDKDTISGVATAFASNTNKFIKSNTEQPETETPQAPEPGEQTIPEESQTTVIVQGNEFGEFDLTNEKGKAELRNKVIKYLSDLEANGESIYCKAINADVKFNKSGIKKYKGLSGSSIKLKLAAKIKEIIKNGTLVKKDVPSYDSEERKNGITYDTIKTNVIVDNKEYGIRTVIRRLPDGKYQYDLQVKNTVNEILDNIEGSPARLTKSDVASLNNSISACYDDNKSKNERMQVILDDIASDNGYVLNLFVEYQDENGNWVELKDDEVESVEEDTQSEPILLHTSSVYSETPGYRSTIDGRDEEIALFESHGYKLNPYSIQGTGQTYAVEKEDLPY